MKLHCLGTTGFHPSPTRHTACYYLPELAIVLDAGSGIFRIIEHLLKDPKRSLTILLSHAHLDHVIGLSYLLDAFAVTELEHVRLIGEREKLEAIRQHLFFDALFPVWPSSIELFALHESAGSMLMADRPSECQLEWFPLEHPGGSIGFSLRAQGRKLSYVTDTVARESADYLDRIVESDLLLHECYFGDEHQPLAEKTGHSWLSAVEQVVRHTRPKQTALIHINPLAETLGNAFSLNMEHMEDLRMTIAADGMTFEF